jgi:hypothetical protein
MKPQQEVLGVDVEPNNGSHSVSEQLNHAAQAYNSSGRRVVQIIPGPDVGGKIEYSFLLEKISE